MQVISMSDEDVAKLKGALLKQKKSEKTAIIVALGLNGILWSLYGFNPTGELLGYAVMAIVVAGVLSGVTFKSGKKLKLDFKERQKEVIEGEIKEKSTTQFKYSTHYQFKIGEEKISIDQTFYNEFTETECVKIERTFHSKIPLTSEKI